MNQKIEDIIYRLETDMAENFDAFYRHEYNRHELRDKNNELRIAAVKSISDIKETI